jgi:carbon monoxide dehydrogenase subunit G
MPKIINTLELTVDAGRAWQVLGDLTDAASWIPGVVSARMNGDVRVCTTVDGGEIRERISGFFTRAHVLPV